MDQKGIKLQMKKICDFVGNFMRSLVVKGLNVRFETHVKRMDRAPYDKRMFFYHTLYMCFEKHAFNA